MPVVTNFLGGSLRLPLQVNQQNHFLMILILIILIIIILTTNTTYVTSTVPNPSLEGPAWPGGALEASLQVDLNTISMAFEFFSR